MDKKFNAVVKAMQKQFDAEPTTFRGEVTLSIPPDTLIPAVELLRDKCSFRMLIDITAVDYWPQEEPRFHMVYHFSHLEDGIVICLRVPLNGHAPKINTLEKLFPNANWLEREVWDMFGVRFEGHSDLRRILMPYDWEGHPLRKDYPLGYEEVQFTFNYDEINVKKPYAKE